MGDLDRLFIGINKSADNKVHYPGLLILFFCLSFIPIEINYINLIQDARPLIWHPSSGLALLFGILVFPISIPVILAAYLLANTLFVGQNLTLELVVYAGLYVSLFTYVPAWYKNHKKFSTKLTTWNDSFQFLMLCLMIATGLAIGKTILHLLSPSTNEPILFVYISTVLREFVGICSVGHFAFLFLQIIENIRERRLAEIKIWKWFKHKVAQISGTLWIETLSVAVIFILGVWVVVSLQDNLVLHLGIISLIPILWCVFRFGRVGNLFNIPMLVALIIWGENSGILDTITSLEVQATGGIFLMVMISLGAIITEHSVIKQQLQASKGSFDLLTEMAPIGICQFNTNLEIESLNKKMQDLLDIDDGGVIHQSILSYIHPDDKKEFGKRMEQFFTDRLPFELTFRISQRDEQTIWLHGDFSIDQSKYLQKFCALCIVTDVSSIKQKEEQFRQNEELLAALVNGIPDPAWLKDSEGRYLTINSVMEKMYQLDRKDVIGKNDKEVWDLQRATLYSETDQKVISTGAPYRFEAPLIPGSDSVWYETVKSPIIIDGHVFGTTGIAREITDRRKIEIALKESEYLTRGLLNNIPDLAWMKGVDGKFLAVNGVFFSLFHSHPEEVVGKSSSEVFPRDVAFMLDQGDEEVLVIARPKIIESVVVDERGFETWFETIKMPLIDDQAKAIGLTGIARDITARKKAEEALQSRLETERIITDISSRLNAIQYSNEEPDINSILGIVGRFLQLDRIFFIHDSQVEKNIHKTYIWLNDGVEDRVNFIDHPKRMKMTWLTNQISQLQTVRINQLADFPPEALQEMEAAILSGIASILILPVGYPGDPVNTILLADMVRHERKWTDSDEQLLRIVSEMLSTTLSRLSGEERVRRAEARYRMLVEQISAVVYIDNHDEMSTGVYMSPQILDMVGYSSEELTSDPMLYWNIIHPDDRERVKDENHQTNISGDIFQIEYRMVTKDGAIIWVEDKAVLFTDENGEKYWFGLLFNVTDRKQIEEALLISETRYQELFDYSPVSLWEENFSRIKKRIEQLRLRGITDFRQHFSTHPRELEKLIGMLDVLNVNQATLSLTNIQTKQDLIVNHRLFRQLKPDELFMEEMIKLAEGETHFEVEGANDIQDGDVRYHHVQVMVVPGYEDTYERVIVAVSDITEKRRAQEKLVYLSTHDSLTGLYSRGFFETEMERFRVSRLYPISVLMADVDFLKETNDQAGHAEGDKLIIQAAQVLRLAFRPEDVIARIGGDEFAVLIPRTGKDSALHMLGRLRNCIENENKKRRKKRPLSLSIGVATANSGDDLSEILKEADRMMYHEKINHHRDMNP